MEQSSFILYDSMWEQFAQLSDDEAGKLIKCIFQYRETWEIPDTDRLTKLMFSPIKNVLDRDREKWKESKEKRSVAWTKGNQKRWWENRNATEIIAMGQNESQDIAKIAVNVNANVNNNIAKAIISNDITSKEVTTSLVVSKQKPEIDMLIDVIKKTVQEEWMIYKPWKYERWRATNILSWKEFGEICNMAWMSREQFCITIIKVAWIIGFWKKINNCEILYKYYADVYNESKMKKERGGVVTRRV